MADLLQPAFTGPELCRLEAHEAVELLRRGEVSPRELLDAALERIAAVEPAINAMPTICAERAAAALDDVGAADPADPGWLGGLPVGIKDLDRVKGVRCTYGTPGLADYVPDFSDRFVELLESRGGIVLGKTNTPEMGAGGNTFNPVFGHTRNPWNVALNPGGSSGGAAAALATGETWLSQGSDHGGSLRTPAAYCGVVGLRPTPGRVPTTLVAGASASRITEGVMGPMARSVRDCALFLDALSGFDPRLPASFPPPDTPFQQAVVEAGPKVRIAYAPDLGGICPVEPAIATVLAEALGKVEAAGGSVDDACPDLTGLIETYYALRGLGFVARDLAMPKSVSRHFKDTIRQGTEFGRSLGAEDIARAYVDATTLFLRMADFLDRFDVLACPTVGCMPRAAEIEWIDEINGVRLDNYMDWLRFAFLATTTGLPAISLPVGLADGLPVGLQLIGPPRGEGKLLAVARAVEMAVGGPLGPIDPVAAGA
ncbi:MAG: amidase [Alphaproteobacteria bacterium]|nr:MAG: amidase [Alphaproteobacteria bacterium]